MRVKVTFIWTISLIAVITACKKDEDIKISGAYSNGIFIVNEGPYEDGTGTITYFNPDSNLVKQDIFEKENGRPLGNIAQSMTVFNGKGYIVLNNSGKIEVVDMATFKSEATISNLTNPSEMIVVSPTKAYVSDWVGQIAVVDLSLNAVTKTIPCASGPDMMAISGTHVFVANSGGLGVDSVVTVIDVNLDQKVNQIKVGDSPSGIAVDANGKVWVLCKGKGFSGWPQMDDTPGKLIRINPATMSVDFTYSFGSSGDHPERLMINKQKSFLYFLFSNGIYQFNVLSEASVPQQLVSRYFYSLGYENKTGFLYASDPKSFTGNGYVFRIKAQDGEIIDSIEAGIIPRAFAFPE